MAMALAYPQYINLFHVLVVTPLLLYVGYMKGEAPSWAFTTLMVLAIGAGLFHAYKLYKWYSGK